MSGHPLYRFLFFNLQEFTGQFVLCKLLIRILCAYSIDCLGSCHYKGLCLLAFRGHLLIPSSPQ